jgi:hypothetical protein
VRYVRKGKGFIERDEDRKNGVGGSMAWGVGGPVMQGKGRWIKGGERLGLLWKFEWRCL